MVLAPVINIVVSKRIDWDANFEALNIALTFGSGDPGNVDIYMDNNYITSAYRQPNRTITLPWNPGLRKDGLSHQFCAV